MADPPIPCLVLNLLFIMGMAKITRYSLMLHIYLQRVVVTFGDGKTIGKSSLAWKRMKLWHWLAYMVRTGEVNIFLLEGDLRGGQVDIPSSQLFVFSVPKAFSGTFKRKKKQWWSCLQWFHSLSTALTVSLLSKMVILWCFPCKLHPVSYHLSSYIFQQAQKRTFPGCNNRSP